MARWMTGLLLLLAVILLPACKSEKTKRREQALKNLHEIGEKLEMYSKPMGEGWPAINSDYLEPGEAPEADATPDESAPPEGPADTKLPAEDVSGD